MEASRIAELAQKPASPAGKQKRQKPQGLFEAGTTGPALKQAFAMLRPDIQWKNPVMFVVEIGAFLTLLSVIQAALGHSDRAIHQVRQNR